MKSEKIARTMTVSARVSAGIGKIKLIRAAAKTMSAPIIRNLPILDKSRLITVPSADMPRKKPSATESHANECRASLHAEHHANHP